MRYAFKLGPLQTGEGRAYAYVAVGEDERVYPAAFTPRDDEGLRALAEDAAGDVIACEPRLGRAAAPLGIATAEMPSWVMVPRADLAAAIALGPERMRGDREAMRTFFEGAAELWRAKPWRHWTDEDLIEVALHGAFEATFEAAIMGAAGITHGVALYPHAGARERIADGAEREDTLAATFADKPRFAIEALRAGYGLLRLPVPVKLERGDHATLEGGDLALLGGVMRACAAITPAHARETMQLTYGEDTIELVVSVLS